MNRRTATGFTLLELLVALAVFAMVSLLAYSGLRTVLQGKQQTAERAERLQQLQNAVLMLERDLGQMASRGIRDGYGDVQPALQAANLGPTLLEFTRAGWRNPIGMPRSTLQRVAYGIEEEVLLRYSWRVLDRAQDSDPDKVRLLGQVREMRLRYLDEEHEWQAQWPPADLAPNDPVPMPVAIEVLLVLEDLGEIRRVVPLPELASPGAFGAPGGGGGDNP